MVKANVQFSSIIDKEFALFFSFAIQIANRPNPKYLWLFKLLRLLWFDICG